VASYIRTIKSFFSFLEREEFIPDNPVRKVKLPKTPKKNMPTFTEKELERLFAQPDKKTSEGYRDYTIMLTLLDTGIRVSELCGLGVGDVDLANGYLRVMGKGQRERYVPIGAKLTKALLKYKLSHRAEAMEPKLKLLGAGYIDSLWDKVIVCGHWRTPAGIISSPGLLSIFAIWQNIS